MVFRKVDRPAVKAALHAVPAILAFALLAFQLAVPWTVAHLHTQDGPSHVYGATVLSGLLLHHKTSVYSRLYTVQRAVLPNWTSTLVLAAASAAAGPAHAEQIFFTLAILTGFLSWAYAKNAVSPQENRWSPVALFLYSTWFLWSAGYYNLYLGIALLPLAIGLYALKGGWLTPRRTAALALLLLLLFATHVVAAASALAVLLTIAFWMHIVTPLSAGERWHARQIALSALACLPAIILLAIFAATVENGATKLEPNIAAAWHAFPKHAFLTSRDDAQQFFAWKALLVCAAISVLLFRRREWASMKGAVAVAAAMLFAIYLLVPDEGLNGADAKIRFGWAFFVVAGLVAMSAARLSWARIPVALLFTWCVWVNTVATQQTAAAVSNALGDYLAVANQIPEGATFVRFRFPTPQLQERYNIVSIGRDPIFHLDAIVAAKRGAIDLSDYEAIVGIFPLLYKRSLNRDYLSTLWGFEGPDPAVQKSFDWVSENFPARIDYALLVGDTDASRAMGSHLEATMQLAADSPSHWFRLYRRR
ncbi:MAG TPA: hypothetical protein VN736_06845 [Candidatus Limnocylindrales bacterium]|nr:hypothetical protein [Candidatus Limnocylindrales bacterium]